MTPGRQAVFWGVLLGLFALALWLLRAILLPFVLGMAFAFLLDPLVCRLERRGLSRTLAASVVVVGSYGVGTAGLLALGPLVLHQVGEFARRLPVWGAAMYGFVRPLVTRALTGMLAVDAAALARSLEAAEQRAGEIIGERVTALLGQGWALVNLVALLAVTPIVAFYLLRDWPRLIERIDDALPRAHAEVIREQAREIERILVGFARGQAIVCVMLGLFYGVALSALGIDFGLLIGLGAGLASFVPYLGAAAGLVTSMGVAIAQFSPHWAVPVLSIIAVFLVGQSAADYGLIPWLVGHRVGLHPLWVIFGVFAGGALLGVAGMLIAVPVCAVIGVLARFAVARYKASALYFGDEAAPSREA